MAGAELFLFYLFGVAAPISIAALNAALGGLTLFFLARLALGSWKPGAEAWLLIGWFGWETVCALASPLRALALNGVLNFWSWTAFLTATAIAPAVRARLPRWSLYLAVSMVLTLPASLAEFLFGTDIFHHQALWQNVPVGAVNAYGYFSHHLTYAGSITVGILFLSAAVVYGERRTWALSTVGILAGLAGLVMSLARTYVVGLAVALPVLLWPKGKKRLLQACVAALLLAVLLAALGPKSMRDRVWAMRDLKNPSIAERVYLWKAALTQWKERPLLGWGPGTYEQTAGAYKAPYAKFIQYPNRPPGFQTRGHCHNLYLMVALQTGAVGLLIFLAFLAAVVRRVLKQADPVLKWGVLSALTAFLVGGLFEYNGGDVEVATLMFFLMGLACAPQAADPRGE